MATRTFSARSIPGVWFNLVNLLWITPALLAQSGATLLGRGVGEFDSGKYSEAIQDLKAAHPRLPKLADYVAFYLASSKAGRKDFASGRADLPPLRKMQSPIPLAPKACLL